MGTRGVLGSQVHFDWFALSGLPDSLVDPVLGNLRFDKYIWRGSTDQTLHGQTLDLYVEGTLEAIPGDLERAAFQKFLGLNATLEKSVELAIFAYYNEVLPIYRDAMGDFADKLAPVLSDSSLIWDLLSSPSLFIAKEQRVSSFEYHFESRWDVEHGLRVIVRDGPIFAVDMDLGQDWDYLTHYNTAGERINV